jgi:2-succinyl-5-enolpyruvyl-6-hydroxy-3-cyclohexene-1-carboxylate synthase
MQRRTIRGIISSVKPAGVHHVAICVGDADTGLAFYLKVMSDVAAHQVARPASRATIQPPWT